MSNIQQKEWRNAVAELKEVTVDRLNSVEEQSAEVKESIEKINAKLDQIEFDAKSATPGQSKDDAKAEVNREFKDAFYRFARGDRNSLAQTEVKSAYHPTASKASSMVRFDLASTGALLLPAQISQDIIYNVVETTPAMQLARVTQTDRSEYKRRARTSTPGGQWLAETATNTKGKVLYNEISIYPHKWASQYGMSIENEQDTGYDLVGEITRAFSEDFAVDMGQAFLSGTGVGQPVGLIGNVSNFTTAASTITANDLIRATESLQEPYQASASWLFTRTARAGIRTLFLTSANAALQYLWEPDFTRQSPTRLLGAPVFTARNGDLAGANDNSYSTGNVFAVFGDFAQAYEIVMREDMYMIDDPYTNASSFERDFHLMTRVGGNVIKSEALTTLTAA